MSDEELAVACLQLTRLTDEDVPVSTLLTDEDVPVSSLVPAQETPCKPPKNNDNIVYSIFIECPSGW